MKNNQSHAWRIVPVGRIMATLIGIFLTFLSFAENKPLEVPYARQIKLDRAPKNVRVRTSDNRTNYVIIAIDDKKNIYDADSVPSGIQVQYYALIEGAWMQTTKKDCGNMLFDNDTLLFDKVSSALFSVGANKKPLSEHPMLDASLVLKRTRYKYRDEFKDYIDSLAHPDNDEYYLRVPINVEGKHVPFWLVVNDTVLIDQLFECAEQELLLDSVTLSKLGLPNDPNWDKDTLVNIRRIQVIPEGHVPSYINKMFVEVKIEIDEGATPPEQSASESDPKSFWSRLWEHVKTMDKKGILVIVLLVILIAIIVFGALKWREILSFIKKSGGKSKQSKRFRFKLGKIGQEGKVKEVIANLSQLADSSMNFKSKNLVISFDVNDSNFDRFVSQKSGEQDEQQTKEDFYEVLKGFVYKATRQGLSGDQKRSFDDELQKAKDTLDAIDTFVKQHQGVGVPKNEEDPRQELEKYKTVFINLLKIMGIKTVSGFDEAVELLEGSVGKWEELKVRLGEPELKDPSEVANRISSLQNAYNRQQEEIGNWKSQTGFDTYASAKTGIEKLKKTIDNLNKEKSNLETKKAELESVVNRVQNDPKSFKGDKDFKELSKLIEDAEEGSNLREELNNKPDKIDRESPTGILVRKGRIFNQYVTIEDKVFKGRDSDSKVAECVANSPIAIQVKKGDFLDKAKNDVKLIREDTEGWIGDSDLKKFVELIVNPDQILNSKWVKTGLYKLVSDVESFKDKMENKEEIKLDDLNSIWLTKRIGGLVDSYNKYLEEVRVASLFGKDAYDTSRLEPVVKVVYDAAFSYLKFGAYKNYWVNIVKPLLDTLGNLQNHIEPENTRALMFYASQFYSIACIMNRIYGDQSFAPKRAEINVSLFNTDVAPAQTSLGFPQLDSDSLMSCKFEYTSDEGEDKKVRYLKQYKPMPFIFIESYYDDNILS